MAYTQTTGRLPFEAARKTGHLPFMNDPLVNALGHCFSRCSEAAVKGNQHPLTWKTLSPVPSGIETVIACDGSYSLVQQDACELVYIRVGVLRMPIQGDSTPLHPYEMSQRIQENSDCIQTVLPADIPCASQEDFQFQVRQAIYATCASRPGIIRTLRWLYTDGWLEQKKPLPPVCCPRCGSTVYLSAADSVTCACGETVFLTDLLGWARDMGKGDQYVQLAARFMLVLEFLLLLTLIREMWEQCPTRLRETLFMHDGPLSIGGRYSQMITPMRRFLSHAAGHGTPIYLCGVEKTGRMVNHLLALNVPSVEKGLVYAVPTHAYIQRQIDGRPLDAEHRYGERILLGERVFVLLPGRKQLVLSVPSCLGRADLNRPLPEDLVGLIPILNTIPDLLLPVYDNALFPISRVNALVSIAQKPCGHLLELFSASLLAPEPEGGVTV